MLGNLLGMLTVLKVTKLRSWGVALSREHPVQRLGGDELLTGQCWIY